MCNTQHDDTTVLKNFPPHPRIPFPLLPGLPIKSRGDLFTLQKDAGSSKSPGPPLRTNEPTRRALLSIMKVPGAALAVLLCTMALCSQVFSAPCESLLLPQLSPLPVPRSRWTTPISVSWPWEPPRENGELLKGLENIMAFLFKTFTFIFIKES